MKEIVTTVFLIICCVLLIGNTILWFLSDGIDFINNRIFARSMKITDKDKNTTKDVKPKQGVSIQVRSYDPGLNWIVLRVNGTDQLYSLIPKQP